MISLNGAQFMDAILTGQPIANAVVHDDVEWHQPFPKAVNARNVVFESRFLIEDSIFLKPAIFVGCHFKTGATMRCTRFCDTAAFSFCCFDGTANFWRARFEKDAQLDNMTVTKGDGSSRNIDAGELNLSWAWFRARANLNRIRIHGAGRFWRTLFFHGVDMDEALFEDLVVFMGRKDQVSIDLTELNGAHDYDLLLERRIIDPDPETLITQKAGEKEKSFYRFAQLQVTSSQEMSKRLAGAPNASALVDSLMRFYAEGSQPMFALDRPSNLRLIDIPSGRIQLIDVDMRPCRLLGTRFTGVELSNVTWPEVKFMPGAGHRAIILDESEPDRPLSGSTRSDLQRLYQDIARAYETQQDSTAAHGFRIAVWEIARIGQHGMVWAMTTWYRYLAGYGESTLIAFAWLGFFVLILFPLMYGITDIFQGEATAAWHKLVSLSVVRSLEISTFIDQGQEAGNATLAFRLIAGVQRILVSSQAWLLLLALKRLSPWTK